MTGFIRDVLRVLSMPCREHTALFSRQLDSPLPWGVAIGLRLHLVYCGGCARFRRQIRRLRELAGMIGRELDRGEPLPDTVRARVLRRIGGGPEKS